MSESHHDDNKQREFICPCGKSYLSYPALFTHIKQKHDGKPPGDIVRPKALNKRGRPRKNVASDSPSDQVAQPEFKIEASRLLFNKEEDSEFKMAVSQIQSAKQRYMANLEFVAPIPTTQISSKQSALPSSPVPTFVEPRASPQEYQKLRLKFKDIFEPIHGSTSMTSSQLEALLQRNAIYRQARQEERKSSRRPIGYNSWEMELRTALFEFLDWAEDSFSKWEYKNLELLVALVIYYYRENDEKATTADYTAELNNFGTYFIDFVKSLKEFQNIYILDDKNYVKVMVLIHQWMRNEHLTGYNMEFSSLFVSEVEENTRESVNLRMETLLDRR